MINAIYKPQDRRYIFLQGDDKELKALEKHLNQIPSYMFLPSFSGIPKPEVFLHKFSKDGKIIYWCHAGLWHECYTFCKKNNIAFNGIHDDSTFKYTGLNISLADFTLWVNSLELNIAPREYQIEAAWKILHFRQSMSQLATRSGKTLIAYIVFRWMIEMEAAHNILMIVPNISLVKQGVSDFSEYKEFFKSETVWAQAELCDSANLTIGTFQSLVKRIDRKSKAYNPKFFSKFDVLLVDECHTAKCKSIDDILAQDFVRDLKIRFGFSGSLFDEGTIESYKVQSLLGPKIQDISSKELMDAGFITPIEITQLRVHYDYDDKLKEQYITNAEYLCGVQILEDGKPKKLQSSSFLRVYDKKLPFAIEAMKKKWNNGEISKEDYIDYLTDICKAKGSNLLLLEQMLMFEQECRKKIMVKLLKKMKKNCIIFAHHTGYLKELKEYFEKELPDKNVRLINGGTAVKKRKEILDEMLENNNCILVASYGCVGTGLTLKNIDYGIFAESFKSMIINKQALGRGLCLANDKDKYRLFDIIDCFPTKRLEFQGKSKEKLFLKEGFEFKVENVNNF